MARLGLATTFSASHGTKRRVSEEFRIALVFQGELSCGVVAGINDTQQRRRLDALAKELDGRYLNEILGRATKERLAEYILFSLQDLNPEFVRVDRGFVFVEVTVEEVDFESYSYRRLLSLAEFYFILERYEEAKASLDQAVSLKHDSPQTFNFRGKCQLRLGNLQQAEMDFKKALELDPNYGEAFRSFGNLYLTQRNFDRMVSAFNRAVELLPNSAIAYNNRGFGFTAMGNTALAIVDHTKAIQLKPRYVEAWRDRAAALESLGRTAEADQDRSRAQEIEEKGMDAFASEFSPY